MKFHRVHTFKWGGGRARRNYIECVSQGLGILRAISELYLPHLTIDPVLSFLSYPFIPQHLHPSPSLPHTQMHAYISIHIHKHTCIYSNTHTTTYTSIYTHKTHSLKLFIFPGISNKITFFLRWDSDPAKTQTGTRTHCLLTEIIPGLRT